MLAWLFYSRTESMLPTALLGICLVLAYKYWRTKISKLLAVAKEIPGPPTLPLVGNALMFVNNDIITLFSRLISQYGNWVRFWLGPDLNIIISDPDDVRMLLKSSKTSERGLQYKYIKALIGEGLLSGAGPVWRRHRKIAAPNFGKQAVDGFTEMFNEESDHLVRKVEGHAGVEIDMYTYIVQSTTYIVCRGIMGLSREETLGLPQLQDVIDMTPGMYDVVFDRMTKWWHQIDPVFWMTSSYSRQKTMLDLIHGLFTSIIRHREATLDDMGKVARDELMNCDDDSKSNTRISVLDRFMLSGEFSHTELVQEAFTIFTASQEATANFASFLLLMMAYHPECQNRLNEEIQSVVGTSLVSDEDLRQMPYLDAVFKEVVRLFPSAVVLQRRVLEDVTIRNTTIPTGCSLVVPIFHMQRDPRFWRNPGAFDPDRFTAQGSEDKAGHAYMPFSLGPMDCLGRHFGTKLIKTIAVKMLQNYEITSNDSYDDLRVVAAISVKSANGYEAILTPRRKGL